MHAEVDNLLQEEDLLQEAIGILLFQLYTVVVGSYFAPEEDRG